MAEDSTVDGLKTGYTEEAGYGLVASAERRGMRLVSVVLGTKSKNARKNETRGLLNYGFRFYETVTQFEGGQELEKPRIWKGQQDYVPVGLLEDALLTLPRGKKKLLDTEIEIAVWLDTPSGLPVEISYTTAAGTAVRAIRANATAQIPAACSHRAKISHEVIDCIVRPSRKEPRSRSSGTIRNPPPSPVNDAPIPTITPPKTIST